MAEIEAHTLRLGRTRVYYQVAGGGEPLVMLHGLSGSSRWWKRNVAALSPHFRLYLFDLMGYGRSWGQRFHLREAAERVFEMLAKLQLHRTNLMGHSMGGFIAADLASRHPEMVDRLVLVDALALPIGRTLFRSAWGLLEGLRYMPFNFLPVLATDAVLAGPWTLLSSTYEIHRADLSQNLKKIAARTQIIWGEHDTLLPLKLGQALHETLPGAEFVVIEGAGHNPMWDRPEAFNQAALAFLKQA